MLDDLVSRLAERRKAHAESRKKSTASRHPGLPESRQDSALPPWEQPGASRRDRDWCWGDVFLMLGLCALPLAACGLLGFVLPDRTKPTTNIVLQGNLDANTPPGGSVSSAVEITDRHGQPHQLSLLFTKQAVPGRWHLTAFISAEEGRLVEDRPIEIAFNKDGSFAAVVNGPAVLQIQFNGQPVLQTVSFNLGDRGKFNGVTQLPDGLPPPRPLVMAQWLIGA
jgi:hypothetical protein